MFNHSVPENWGICPTIHGIPTYSIFVALALFAAIGLYFYNSRDSESLRSDEAIKVVIAAFIGGILGAKLPVVLLNLTQGWNGIETILAGRTIVGGMIGGLLSVILVKRHFKIRKRYGNVLAPSVALAMAIGRIGCFLSGCCYGIPTNTTWGCDFGDSVLRYPTQLFEMTFCFVAFAILQLTFRKMRPGRALSLYFLGYFIFRFCIEFIRVNPMYMALTVYQWISIAGIIFLVIKMKFNKKIVKQGENNE